jgi:hypothetical protein
LRILSGSSSADRRIIVNVGSPGAITSMVPQMHLEQGTIGTRAMQRLFLVGIPEMPKHSRSPLLLLVKVITRYLGKVLSVDSISIAIEHDAITQHSNHLVPVLESNDKGYG